MQYIETASTIERQPAEAVITGVAHEFYDRYLGVREAESDGSLSSEEPQFVAYFPYLDGDSAEDLEYREASQSARATFLRLVASMEDAGGLPQLVDLPETNHWDAKSQGLALAQFGGQVLVEKTLTYPGKEAKIFGYNYYCYPTRLLPGKELSASKTSELLGMAALL